MNNSRSDVNSSLFWLSMEEKKESGFQPSGRSPASSSPQFLNRAGPSSSITSTVWLSKKMKDAVQTELEDDRKRSSSQHGYSKSERQRTFGRYHSFDSSYDRIGDQTKGMAEAYYFSKDEYLASPSNSKILKYHGAQPSDLQERTKTYPRHNAMTNQLGPTKASTPKDRLNKSSEREPTLEYKSRYNRSNSAQELTAQYNRATPGTYNHARVHGSDDDKNMENILRELEDTGFFKKPDPRTAYQTSSDRCEEKKINCNGKVDYKKLALVSDDLLKIWEDSQTLNTQLHKELSEAKKDLEETRYHAESIAKQVAKDTAVTQRMKREKATVLKKMNEMEEELKLLAFSGNLTDKTLDQLKSDNDRLRSENSALLHVIATMS